MNFLTVIMNLIFVTAYIGCCFSIKYIITFREVISNLKNRLVVLVYLEVKIQRFS